MKGSVKLTKIYPCRRCNGLHPEAIGSYWTTFNNGTVYNSVVKCGLCANKFTKPMNHQPTFSDYREQWNHEMNIDIQITQAENRVTELKKLRKVIKEYDEVEDLNDELFEEDYGQFDESVIEDELMPQAPQTDAQRIDKLVEEAESGDHFL